ncbi:hypothetical protein D0X99_19780 [Algoriphagus lacus]|uniref:Uncharacterized protein n=1 Tax=Algoriphagus lacus TaxID=2056311 RepID=A0A418PLS4_9BACT|nr:hypothetical protein [Algoriphagus lacus]RIW12096.1 hypothetical protein D0X99_19780 [Algoriphagus lacus]
MKRAFIENPLISLALGLKTKLFQSQFLSRNGEARNKESHRILNGQQVRESDQTWRCGEPEPAPEPGQPGRFSLRKGVQLDQVLTKDKVLGPDA